jgi:hypothetical protein
VRLPPPLPWHSFLVNGQRGSSCHGVLEMCGLLTDEYHATVQVSLTSARALSLPPPAAAATEARAICALRGASRTCIASTRRFAR